MFFSWSFIRMRGFDSMACGFLLLTWSDTIRLWTNLYLYVHVIMIFTIVLTKLYLTLVRPKKSHISQTKNFELEKKEE